MSLRNITFLGNLPNSDTLGGDVERMMPYCSETSSVLNSATHSELKTIIGEELPVILTHDRRVLRETYLVLNSACRLVATYQ